MRKLLIGAFVLTFVASAPAIADNHRGHGGGGGNHPSAHMGGGHAPARAHFANSRPATAHRTMRTSTYRTVRHTSHHGTTDRVVRHTTRHTRPAHHTTRHVVKRTVVHKNTARFAHLRRAVHAHHRFHVGIYRRPHGWYAHRWVIGNRLPRAWFVRDYWITDWSIYGLWAPIDGLVWVRVGPDAMLIDPATGEVIGVEYGIFW